MRVTNDVLSGLLRPPAPQPKQPTSRERALANRLRVLRTVAEHGHLRCSYLATCGHRRHRQRRQQRPRRGYRPR